MKRKKLLTVIGSVCLSLILVALLLPACAPEELSELEAEVAALEAEVAALEAELAEEVEVYKWRMQQPWTAAENYYWEYYADIVREMTDGQIDISVFAADELVPVEDVATALGIGTLEMAAQGPYTYSTIIPAGKIESLPLVIPTLEEWQAIWYRYGLEEEFRQLFLDTYDIYLLGAVPNDFGGVVFIDSFTCLDDLDGRVINMGGSLAEVFAPFGMSPITVAYGDIYTSLATGLLDGCEWGGIKCMYECGFFEVAKYFMLPYYVNAWSPCWVIGNSLYESLPSNLQAILREATRCQGIYMRSTYFAGEAEHRRLAEEELGLQVITLPQEDVDMLYQISVDYLYNLREDPEAATVVNILLDAMRGFGHID